MRTLTTALLALLAINCTEGGSAQTGEEQNLTQKERADQKIPGALSCQVQLGEGQVAADACAYASEDELGACISLVTLFPSSAGVGLGVTRRFVSETREAKTMATLEGDAIDIQWNEGEEWVSLKRTAEGKISGAFTAEQDFEFKTTCHATATDSLACVLSSSCKYQGGDDLGYCLAGLSLKQIASNVELTIMQSSKSKYQRTVNSDGGDLKGESIDVQFNDGEDSVSLLKLSNGGYAGTLTLEEDFAFEIACEGK